MGLSRGVDGLITDKPDLARAVIERRAAMSNSERFLVAQLIRSRREHGSARSGNGISYGT